MHQYEKRRFDRNLLFDLEKCLGEKSYNLFLDGSFWEVIHVMGLISRIKKKHGGEINILYRDIFSPMVHVTPADVNFIKLSRDSYKRIRQICRDTRIDPTLARGCLFPTSLEWHRNLPELVALGLIQYSDAVCYLFNIKLDSCNNEKSLSDENNPTRYLKLDWHCGTKPCLVPEKDCDIKKRLKFSDIARRFGISTMAGAKVVFGDFYEVASPLFDALAPKHYRAKIAQNKMHCAVKS